MERPVLRAVARSRVVAPSLNLVRFHQPRRLLSTAPPSQKSRSWKNTALRWGIAIGGVYFYNTSNLFAADSAYAASKQIVDQRDGPEDQTLEGLLARRRQISSNSEAKGPPSPAVAELEQGQGPDESPPTLEEYEDEADSQGAFNPETGEINWDCPCLGGMAHGPCGPEFRAAFSCFVYSNEEPKGMDCIEKFKGMQDCFRQHPDIYGEELNEEEEEQDRQRIESEARTGTSPSAPSGGEKVAYSGPAQTEDLTEEDAAKRSRAKRAADKM